MVVLHCASISATSCFLSWRTLIMVVLNATEDILVRWIVLASCVAVWRCVACCVLVPSENTCGHVWEQFIVQLYWQKLQEFLNTVCCICSRLLNTNISASNFWTQEFCYAVPVPAFQHQRLCQVVGEKLVIASFWPQQVSSDKPTAQLINTVEGLAARKLFWNDGKWSQGDKNTNPNAALCPLDVEICNSWLIYTSDKTFN